jgi:hypothetical protein
LADGKPETCKVRNPLAVRVEGLAIRSGNGTVGQAVVLDYVGGSQVQRPRVLQMFVCGISSAI